MNEQLYLYMLHKNSVLADFDIDFNFGFWYTVVSYWIDQCGGGSNILWYLRRTYRYCQNSECTPNEKINRYLQIIHILKYFTLVTSSSPNQSQSQRLSIQHINNYEWALGILSDDIRRKKQLVNIFNSGVKPGPIVTVYSRYHPLVISKSLSYYT